MKFDVNLEESHSHSELLTEMLSFLSCKDSLTSLRAKSTMCLLLQFCPFIASPVLFLNLPHFKADGLHPRIGPLLFILIQFFSTSFHSGCSYIGVITIQHSPEGSRCKIQSATKQDLTPKLPYVEAVKPHY